MKSPNLIYLSSLFCIFAIYISAVEEKIDNTLQAQSMLAVLYAQSSAEYDANNIQTYTGAKLALDVALTKKNWTRRRGRLDGRRPRGCQQEQQQQRRRRRRRQQQQPALARLLDHPGA